MSHVQESITIHAPKTEVFDAFVQQIDAWWPRLGTYRYSFVQRPQKPLNIQFEPKENGRFIETFDDGSFYEIGCITEWDPPDRLIYTWCDPHWPNPTTVEVTFFETNGATTVTVRHSGFGKKGVPDVSSEYQIGTAEILSVFAQWYLLNRR